MFQNYTAQIPANVEEIKASLAKQVAGSVLWEKCLRAAVATGVDTVIEFGPGNVLTGLAKRTIPELKCVNINSVDTLNAAEF
jgi:[acyl-carrier-protein] S-malonyltransferase